MALGEGDTWNARCHTHKLQAVYVEGGGPIKATTKRKKMQKKRKKKEKKVEEGERVAWERPKREEVVPGEKQNLEDAGSIRWGRKTKKKKEERKREKKGRKKGKERRKERKRKKKKRRGRKPNQRCALIGPGQAQNETTLREVGVFLPQFYSKLKGRVMAYGFCPDSGRICMMCMIC